MFFGGIETFCHFVIFVASVWAIALVVYIFLFAYHFYNATDKRGICFLKHWACGIVCYKPCGISPVILKALPLRDKSKKSDADKNEGEKTDSVLAGKRNWVVQEDILITINDSYTAALLEIKKGDKVLIPRCFRTDGASVPRSFWFISSPTGMLFRAALLHDYACRKGEIIIAGKSAPLKKSMLFWELLFLRIAIETNGRISLIIHLIPFLALVCFRRFVILVTKYLVPFLGLVCFGWFSWFGRKKTADDANDEPDKISKKIWQYVYLAFNLFMGTLILYLLFLFFREFLCRFSFIKPLCEFLSCLIG